MRHQEETSEQKSHSPHEKSEGTTDGTQRQESQGTKDQKSGEQAHAAHNQGAGTAKQVVDAQMTALRSQRSSQNLEERNEEI